MMVPFTTDYVPEKYTDYKNRVVQKHIDKITNQLRQIWECSLKPDDKKALVKKLIDLINAAK